MDQVGAVEGLNPDGSSQVPFQPENKSPERADKESEVGAVGRIILRRLSTDLDEIKKLFAMYSKRLEEWS